MSSRFSLSEARLPKSCEADYQLLCSLSKNKLQFKTVKALKWAQLRQAAPLFPLASLG